LEFIQALKTGSNIQSHFNTAGNLTRSGIWNNGFRRQGGGLCALVDSASGPFPEIVRILLEKGADPNISDKSENFTALMFAAAEGQAEVVRVLLLHGASWDKTDADGETALDFARSNGHSEVVQLLEKIARDLER